MIGTKSFKVDDGINIFDISISHKFNVILGESGTYKTKLIKDLLTYQDDPLSSGVEVISDSPVYAISRSNWERYKNETNSIFIFDEDVTFFKRPLFGQYSKKSSNYFIFLTRENISQFPINVNAIFELKSSNDRISNIIYKDFFDRDLIDIISYENLYIEDSKSGLQLLQRIYPDKSVNTTYVKDNIKNNIGETIHKSSLIFADGAAFGNVLIAIENLCNEFQIDLYLYPSVEWILLHAKEFEEYLNGELDSPQDHHDTLEFNSWEKYFTYLLNKLSEKLWFQSYTKQNIYKELLSETNLEAYKTLLPETKPSVGPGNPSMEYTFNFL